jgi:hypothetical protein
LYSIQALRRALLVLPAEEVNLYCLMGPVHGIHERGTHIFRQIRIISKSLFIDVHLGVGIGIQTLRCYPEASPVNINNSSGDITAWNGETPCFRNGEVLHGRANEARYKTSTRGKEKEDNAPVRSGPVHTPLHMPPIRAKQSQNAGSSIPKQEAKKRKRHADQREGAPLSLSKIKSALRSTRRLLAKVRAHRYLYHRRSHCSRRASEPMCA